MMQIKRTMKLQKIGLLTMVEKSKRQEEKVMVAIK